MNVDVKPDRSENVKYDFTDYFAYLRKGFLSQYPNYCALSHWHDDFEFVSVISGEMEYNINGNIVKLSAGDGLFVNARQLHYGFSERKTECEFICCLLHPLLLCLTPQIEQTFVTPVLTDPSFPFLVLNAADVTHKRILTNVAKLCFEVNPAAPQLSIQSIFCQIWIDLYSIAPKSHDIEKSNASLSSVKEMLRFLQDRFTQKITLNEIASAGNVCKSKCCALFRLYLNQTPFEYLTRFRLLKSVEAMRESDMNLTEIAFYCGFSGASYFAETFKKYYGCSPSAYRQKDADNLF